MNRVKATGIVIIEIIVEIITIFAGNFVDFPSLEQNIIILFAEGTAAIVIKLTFTADIS